MQKFTLVSTVFNEMRRLNQTIADIEAQTLRPAEIIITDAGSTDGTFERLLKWKEESATPIVVLQKNRCNVAQGRNLAISAANYDLIASTDFGCRFKPTWLESIITPFDGNPTLEVVGGAFSIIREEVNTPAAKADFVLTNGYPVVMDEYFSVSSRSIAYKKHVWKEIGGYPEWLTLAADDTIFWRQIKKKNYKYYFSHSPEVFWLRHKKYIGFGKEAYRYGLGDGEGHINYRNFWSHVIETACRYTLPLNLLSMPFTIPAYGWLLPVLVLLVQLFGLRSYRNAFKNWLEWKNEPGFGISVLFACFTMVEYTRIYYIKGYIQGLFRSTPAQREAAAKLQATL